MHSHVDSHDEAQSDTELTHESCVLSHEFSPLESRQKPSPTWMERAEAGGGALGGVAEAMTGQSMSRSSSLHLAANWPNG